MGPGFIPLLCSLGAGTTVQQPLPSQCQGGCHNLPGYILAGPIQGEGGSIPSLSHPTNATDVLPPWANSSAVPWEPVPTAKLSMPLCHYVLRAITHSFSTEKRWVHCSQV